MKKLFLLLLFSAFFNCSNFIYAQSLSIEETKKVLSSNKWLISRTEEDGERAPVEKEMQGQKWVFKTNGTVYIYLPTEKESAAPNYVQSRKGLVNLPPGFLAASRGTNTLPAGLANAGLRLAKSARGAKPSLPLVSSSLTKNGLPPVMR